MCSSISTRLFSPTISRVSFRKRALVRAASRVSILSLKKTGSCNAIGTIPAIAEWVTKTSPSTVENSPIAVSVSGAASGRDTAKQRPKIQRPVVTVMDTARVGFINNTRGLRTQAPNAGIGSDSSAINWNSKRKRCRLMPAAHLHLGQIGAFLDFGGLVAG